MLNIQNRFCFLVLTFLSADIASVIAVSKVSFHSTVEERIKQETKPVLKQEAKSDYSCTVSGLIGEQPDFVCFLVKQLSSLRHYGDCQDILPNFFIFKGKPGSGKKTAVKWMIKESGASEIWIHANSLITGKIYLDDVYEQADQLAKKSDHPVVIVIEEADLFSGPRIKGDYGFSVFMGCTHMWNYYHKNPYITTIYLYKEFNPRGRRDIINRCVGVFFNAPDKQTRKQIIEKYLPEKHGLSEKDIESMVYWTRGLSGGQLIQFIKDAQVLAQKNNEILSSQHINSLLKKVFWSEHIDPNKKTIIMTAGFVLTTTIYALTRKYHAIWIANIRGSAFYTKIKDLIASFKQTQQNNNSAAQNNGNLKK